MMNPQRALQFVYVLTALVTIGASAGALPAQREPAAGVIDGVVTDTSLAPLADASASILGADLKITTGANGRFVIRGLPAGQYVLLIRRLGYAASSHMLELSERDTLRVSFALERTVTALDTVRVAATQLARMSPRMTEFEARRKAGDGQFMTEAEIEKLNFVSLSDVFRTFQSVAVGSTVLNARMRPLGCPLQFFIDGIAIAGPRNMELELPSPKEIAGIEVYVNSASVPLQYKSYGGKGGFCGVVLLWTRD